MKRVLDVIALLAVLSLSALAANPQHQSWNALGILRNARYVYVTSYDGSQFSRNLFPGDSAAIAAVQNAIEDDGYGLVYRPSEADMILVVQTRPSSDLLAVYQGGKSRTGTYLWRAEARNGFSGSDPVLVRQLERALETAGAKK
jgi:hypothetical protein